MKITKINLNLITQILIFLIYSVYYFLVGVGGIGENIINFNLNDIDLYTQYSEKLNNFYSNFNLDNLKYTNLKILFSPNVILLSFFQFFKNTIFFYKLINIFLIYFIYLLINEIYKNLCKYNQNVFKFISLTYILFFPSFIYNNLTLGKDIYSIILSLLVFFILSSKQNNRKLVIYYIFLFLLSILLMVSRTIQTLLIYLISFISFIHFTYLNDDRELKKKFYFIFTLFFLSIIFYYFIGSINIHDSLQAAKELNNSNKEFLNSKNFLSKFLYNLLTIRDSFNNYQNLVDANTSIYQIINFNRSIDIFIYIAKLSLLSLLPQDFFKLLDARNIFEFAISIENFIIFILLIIILLDKKKFLYNFTLLFLLSFFFGFVEFCFPNLGTIVRYKSFVYPILLVYGALNLNKLIDKKNFVDNFIKKINYKTFIFILLYLTFLISIIFRDSYVLNFLDISSNKKYILLLVTLSIFMNIFYSLNIDNFNFGKLNINKVGIIFSIILIFLLNQFNQTFSYIELFFMSLLFISLLFNFNLNTNLVIKNKILKFYIIQILLIFSFFYIFKNIELNFQNILVYFFSISFLTNILFFRYIDLFYFKSAKIKNFDVNIYIIINQIIVILIYYIFINSILNNNIQNHFAYVIKVIYGLAFSTILFSKIIFISNNKNTNYFSISSYLKINDIHFTIFLTIIFNLFIFVLLKFISFFLYEFNFEIYNFLLTLLFLNTLFINLIFQKLILNGNATYSFLTINLFNLFINFILFYFKFDFNFIIILSSFINLILPLVISIIYYKIYNQIRYLKTFSYSIITLFLLSIFIRLVYI